MVACLRITLPCILNRAEALSLAYIATPPGDLRVSDQLSIVVDGIETIGLHNGLFRIRLFVLDASGRPTPAVELVAGASTVRQIQQGLSQIKY